MSAHALAPPAGGQFETLAQAIERVWSQNGGSWPARGKEGAWRADPRNRAHVWVLTTHVEEPVSTGGTGEALRREQ